MNYDAAVFIARVQPIHLGHKQVVTQGLNLAKEVIIVVGSARTARNIRNPFTYEERVRMIRASFTETENQRIKITGVPDYPYDEHKWVAAVQTAVMGTIKFSPDPLKIALIGHSKDHTSYYLKMFPFWVGEEVSNYRNISATAIRDYLFLTDGSFINPCDAFVHNAAVDVLRSIIRPDQEIQEWFKTLCKEYRMIEAYKEMWKAAPFPPTFVTVDAVVVQSGHVLLVKRKAMPGEGLWALPGGFLNQQETLLDGALRELKEETRIKVPVPVLRGSIKKQHTFDAPNRSLRGRTITTAFFIDLGFSEELPKIKAGDDAEKAAWVPFKDVRPSVMYEDHAAILDFFVNLF